MGHIGLALAEPLEEHVAPERDPDGAEASVGVTRDQQMDDFVEIGGVARVIERPQAVQLTAARSEVQGDGAPAALECLAHQAHRVVRSRGALEAVEHEQDGRARRLSGRPVEVAARHAELVAQRLVRYANLVGRENVIAGSDCGLGGRLHPDIVWAKFRSQAEGARLATKESSGK